MSKPLADMSIEAQQVFTELSAAGIVVPTANNYLQYRKDLLASGADPVRLTLAQYEVEVEQIDVAGISCKQQTPPAWSPQNGICILYAYGGGYVSGSTFEDQVITIAMASQADARVVALDYRLSPEHPYPAAQQDMTKVYLALLQQ